jgi:GT2 family glycosyltransferase
MKTAIIVVNYKTPWHLNECLKSIFKYTENFHLIVVQNGIDPSSIKVTDKYKKKYPNDLTVIVNEKNLGLVGGVNSAYVEGMKYERVCFVNSDIIVTKDWLKELNVAMDNDQSVVQVAPDVSHYYEESLFWRIIKWQVMRRSPKFGAWVYKLILNFNPPRSSHSEVGFEASTKFYQFCTGACNLVQTKYFKERGFFWDPNIFHGYGDDFDTTYYLRQFGKIGVTNRSYVFHFLNVSFNSFNPTRIQLKQKLQLFNKLYVIDKWKDRLQKDISEMPREELLNLAQHSDEIKTILDYFGLLKVSPGFSEYIKTLPAKVVWEELNN